MPTHMIASGRTRVIKGIIGEPTYIIWLDVLKHHIEYQKTTNMQPLKYLPKPATLFLCDKEPVSTLVSITAYCIKGVSDGL